MNVNAGNICVQVILENFKQTFARVPNIRNLIGKLMKHGNAMRDRDRCIPEDIFLVSAQIVVQSCKTC